jgi:NAD(P)-dependent dehydrogenase (short-subunit alcohol dehydrogenase family)
MRQLEGKRVLATGGASGIGRGLWARFAQAGLGEHVLRGIRRNADDIFSHGDLRGMLERRFGSVVVEFDA